MQDSLIRPTLDRFVGSFLGLIIGDSLGSPFEGLTADIIYHSFGSVRKIYENPPVDWLCYTDDTQMTIGVAQTLCALGSIDPDELVRRFVANYDPRRGYGQGARRLMAVMSEGGDWRKASEDLFPGGSFGNGGAMRVAPIGLLFCRDLDKVWEQAEKSARVTHAHPWGIEGAQLMAVSVALAAREPKLDAAMLYDELRKRATQEEYQWLLKTASRLKPGDSLHVLGNSIEAHRSVVTAITCFAQSMDDYQGVIVRAIGMGNDVDTLAAMAGALSGARLGQAALPTHLIAKLENHSGGRELIVSLAHRLYEKFASAENRG
jgi:poly(ADP-ribose) glycohydrolase ARH3